MICLDVSALIGLFNGQDSHHHESVRLISQYGRQGLMISPLNLAEVLVGPTRHGLGGQTKAAIAKLGITVAPIREDFAESIALIRVDTRLTLPDCCVILAAEGEDAAILSFDKKLQAVATSRGLKLVS